MKLDGFGTGSFDWTTTDAKNAFVDSEGLHIVPTLTTSTTAITPAQLVDGSVLCSPTILSVANTALGTSSILPPLVAMEAALLTPIIIRTTLLNVLSHPILRIE